MTFFAQVKMVMCFDCSQVIQAGMFNQNSTSSERKAFLRALLDADNDDDDVRIVGPNEKFITYVCNTLFFLYTGYPVESKKFEQVLFLILCFYGLGNVLNFQNLSLRS